VSFGSSLARRRTLTRPLAVNLIPFEIRLETICLTRSGSPRTQVGRLASNSASSTSPLAEACAWNSPITSRVTRSGAKTISSI